jgi:hypothetical protein
MPICYRISGENKTHFKQGTVNVAKRCQILLLKLLSKYVLLQMFFFNVTNSHSPGMFKEMTQYHNVVLITIFIMFLRISSEVSSHVPLKGFRKMLWNTKVYYCVHKSAALIPVQMNPVHTTPSFVSDMFLI